MRISLRFFFLFLLPIAVCGQSKQVDSLLIALENAKTDTSRVSLHYELSRQYALYDLAKATEHAKTAEALARETAFIPGLAKALNQRGHLLLTLGEFDKSLKTYYQALKVGLQVKDTSFLITTYSSLGVLSHRTKQQEKALHFFGIAKDLAIKSGNNLGLSKVYNNLGHLHAENKTYGKALTFFIKAEKLHEIESDKKNYAIVLLNIGEVYTLLGQPQEGRKYLLKALALDHEIQNKMNLPLTLCNLAKSYLAEKNYTRALEYAHSGYKAALETESSKKIKAAASLLNEIYATTKDYELAYQYQLVINEHQDKLEIDKQNRNAAEMSARFENEKLDLETQKLKAEKENQALELTHQRGILALGLVAVLLLSVGVVELYLRRIYLKKKNQQLKAYSAQLQSQNLEIVRQKSEITGQAQMLKKQNVELESHSQFKNKIFSIVSHDLRSPFTSLQGIIALAKDDKLTEKDLKRIFLVLGKDVEVILEMLNNLLVWSKNQMDGSGIQPASVNLTQLVQDCVHLVGPKAEQKEVVVEVSMEGIITAHADRESLAFVLRNLLENAIKFSYPGAKIHISAFQEQDTVRLSVADAGKGISLRNQDKLFSNQRFTTLGTSNEVGTGLGLMLCKELLMCQNGYIEVDSAEGRGTVFSVILPVQPMEAKEVPTEPELAFA